MGTSPLLYFAFGSNLDPEQLARRVPGAAYLRPGVLRDHTLAFVARPGQEGPGVAHLEPKPGARAWGMLIRFPADGWETMDLYEGTPRVYQRAARLVEGPKGRAPVWVGLYLMGGSPRRAEPAPAYLDRVARGYQYWRLPVTFLREAVKASR